MSNYAPGTVAMVTYEGERHRAMLESPGSRQSNIWHFSEWLPDPWGVQESDLSDITPLVCIEADAALADLLDDIVEARDLLPFGVGDKDRFLRLRDAIREQTPAPPEIPENLGAVVETGNGCHYVYSQPRVDRPWRLVGCAENVDPWYDTNAVRQVALRVLSEGVPS